MRINCGKLNIIENALISVLDSQKSPYRGLKMLQNFRHV